MMGRPLQSLLFLSIIVVAGGAAIHAAQERSAEAGQQWQIAGTFARSEPGPLERQAKPVTPENPIPRRTRLVRPPYPPEAAVVGARATVTLRVVVDHLGTVGEVRTVGAPILGAMSPPSPPEERAFTAGLLALIRSAKDAVGQWLYDPPADAPIAFDVVIGFTSQAADGEVVAQSTGQTSLSSGEVPGPIDRGTSNVPGPRKIKHVNPIYPAAAREKKITGVVVVEARVGGDGRVVESSRQRSSTACRRL